MMGHIALSVGIGELWVAADLLNSSILWLGLLI